MRFFKLIMVLFLSFMMVPNIVFAEGSSIKLEAPTTASKDDEILVNINLETDVSVNEFKATITYETTVLEMVTIENKNGWKQETSLNNESPLTLTFTHENGLARKINIATVKFKVKKDVAKSSTTINVEGTTKIRDDETINTLEKATVKIDIKSTDNTLSDLKVNDKTVVNFSPTTYTYSMQVDASTTTINIDGTLNDKTASFKDKLGPRKGASLDYGENVFEIVVISASKEERKYVITITRQDNRGTNNNLGDIILNSNRKLLEFDSNTLLYTITTHKLDKISIAAITQDPKATIKIDKLDIAGGEGEIPLEPGSNTIKITVASEKKEEKVYTLIINNSEEDVDTRLKSLDDVIFGLDEEIDFNPDIYDYVVRYKSKYKDSLTIKDEKFFKLMNPNDAEVSVSKPSNLKPGDKIIITVSAKDGTKNADSYYTITFVKDTRINFFLLLSLLIFIVLLVIFIRLVLKSKKTKHEIEEKKKDLEKTKRLEKINLE